MHNLMSTLFSKLNLLYAEVYESIRDGVVKILHLTLHIGKNLLNHLEI
jgi:hypothetical protein